MYVLGGFLSNVGSAIMDGIRTLMLTLCDGVYKLIYIAYFIFEKLGTAKILTEDQVAGIFRRIGLIIGIFMLFRLTFAFIQYIIDPDAMADKKKGMGNIIKKILISIVLLGSTSTLFNLAFKVQNLIIDNHIISKVIFNSNEGASDNFGAELSAEVFTSFFRLNPDAVNANTLCATLLTNDSNGKNVMYTSTVNNNGEVTEAYKCVTEKDSNDEYIATFDGGGFIPLIMGIIIAYTLITYTIQVGVRVIQLAYLQIIAPVPIMMYITPQGEDKLKKWGQQCLTTFLDFFLRTMIIYFAVFVLQNIWENHVISDILSAGNAGSTTWQTAYISVIMIIAVLVFAKKVPKLIKEIFPALEGSAGFDYGLSSPEMKKALTFGLGATAGAVAGAAVGFKQGKGTLTGRAGNAFTGFFRGAAGGAKTKGSIVGNVKKGMSSQRAASQKAYERNNDGSTFWGRTLGASGASITKEAFDRELSLYSDYNSVADLIDKELEKDAAVQTAMARKQALLERGTSGGPAPTAAEIKNADALIKKAKKSALQVEIGRGTNGKIMSALANAEAIRAKGQEKGYAGFGTTSLTTGSAVDRMDAFFGNKDSTGIETNEIKGAGGSRNAEYKKAEANAKYNKTK